MRVLFGAGVSCAVATETKVLRHPSKALQCGKGDFTLLGLTLPPVGPTAPGSKGRARPRCSQGTAASHLRLAPRG
jgi:hypothetical protein